MALEYGTIIFQFFIFFLTIGLSLGIGIFYIWATLKIISLLKEIRDHQLAEGKSAPDPTNKKDASE